MEWINRKCYFIGITGEIGSGKTTVSNILRDYGYSVFDTDLFSKKILIENKFIMEIIEKIVGQKVSRNYKMDFKKIGQIFDDNPKLEEKFEDWYQVFLGKEIMQKALFLKNEEKILFFDIPLLEKKGISNKFDYLWIVESKQNKCYERIKHRNNYSNKKIEYLIQNSKINKDLLLSNYKIIDNNKSIEDLKILIKFELDNLKAKFKL
ncbi:dephospho-CoA kinase [Clostridium baratii str. Sullivan]|uniref:Dephospho-CoA kinase n=1 Tax=Clostridium baratii str. Sullivan TaxID=1415775 RepID=A0A0A7G1N4_9CLOT|nr:dephospho-CoA kinase [Clostridium baratii]AIY84925.1 dephospho-CoA kinase [Clostridium baratii str. Sullivan]